MAVTPIRTRQAAPVTAEFREAVHALVDATLDACPGTEAVMFVADYSDDIRIVSMPQSVGFRRGLSDEIYERLHIDAED